jgi:hypothetical protein
MATLYDQNPAAWDAIGNKGFVYIKEMSKHFTRPSMMSEALGAVSAAQHWHAGRNMPKIPNEKKAQAYLEARGIEVHIAPRPGAWTPVEPSPKSAGTLLLVATKTSEIERVKKVLNILGCEWVEV